jgi:hypothetical protein
MPNLGKRTNSSFDRRLKIASEDIGGYFTPELMKYWKLCYKCSIRKQDARKVLNAFAMKNYIFLMDLVIKHLFQHLREIVQDIKSPEGSITYHVRCISLIEFGQRILESIMPETSYNPKRPLPVVEGKTFVHRVSGYTEEECGELRILFKEVLRKIYPHLDSKVKESLNATAGEKFWFNGSDTGLFIPLVEYLSMCDVCNKKVCTCDEETPSAPAQASDPLQALATELIDAKISFGERAHQIATVLLENGVFQLSHLSVLKQSGKFDSVVQKLQLNALQFQNLRVALRQP